MGKTRKGPRLIAAQTQCTAEKGVSHPALAASLAQRLGHPADRSTLEARNYGRAAVFSPRRTVGMIYSRRQDTRWRNLEVKLPPCPNRILVMKTRSELGQRRHHRNTERRALSGGRSSNGCVTRHMSAFPAGGRPDAVGAPVGDSSQRQAIAPRSTMRLNRVQLLGHRDERPALAGAPTEPNYAADIL